MENLLSLFGVRIAFAAPPPVPSTVKTFIGKVSTEILNPIIAILFAVASLYFLYGIALYIWSPDNEEARENGRVGMMYGIIGMFVMVSVFGILKFIINTTGADTNLINYV